MPEVWGTIDVRASENRVAYLGCPSNEDDGVPGRGQNRRRLGTPPPSRDNPRQGRGGNGGQGRPASSGGGGNDPVDRFAKKAAPDEIIRLLGDYDWTIDDYNKFIDICRAIVARAYAHFSSLGLSFDLGPLTLWDSSILLL